MRRVSVGWTSVAAVPSPPLVPWRGRVGVLPARAQAWDTEESAHLLCSFSLVSFSCIFFFFSFLRFRRLAGPGAIFSGPGFFRVGAAAERLLCTRRRVTPTAAAQPLACLLGTTASACRATVALQALEPFRSLLLGVPPSRLPPSTKSSMLKCLEPGAATSASGSARLRAANARSRLRPAPSARPVACQVRSRPSCQRPTGAINQLPR